MRYPCWLKAWVLCQIFDLAFYKTNLAGSDLPCFLAVAVQVDPGPAPAPPTTRVEQGRGVVSTNRTDCEAEPPDTSHRSPWGVCAARPGDPRKSPSGDSLPALGLWGFARLPSDEAEISLGL